MTASDLKSLADEEEKISSLQVEAWNSHDLEAIRNVYTQDIVHYDGYPKFIGIDEVMGMAKEYYREWVGQLGDIYVGQKEWISAWEYWNVFEYTQENPLREYDLLRTRDGRISYWRLFYLPEFLSKHIGVTVNTKLLEDYATAWSSGDPQKVAAFYVPEAVHYDSIIGDYAEGRDAIQAYAERYFSWFPNTSLELVQPFGETLSNQAGNDVKIMQGGVYTVHTSKKDGSPCDVRMLVLLETSNASVVSERNYYNTDSLIACDCPW